MGLSVTLFVLKAFLSTAFFILVSHLIYFCNQIKISGLLFYSFVTQIGSMKSVVMLMHYDECNFLLTSAASILRGRESS